MSLKNAIKEFKAHLGDKESLLDTQYQRIAEMIQLHWGYKEFYLFINKLLVVERDRNRQGFPLDVLDEIYTLQEIHEKVFPHLKGLRNNDLETAIHNPKKPNSMLV